MTTREEYIAIQNYRTRAMEACFRLEEAIDALEHVLDVTAPIPSVDDAVEAALSVTRLALRVATREHQERVKAYEQATND